MKIKNSLRNSMISIAMATVLLLGLLLKPVVLLNQLLGRTSRWLLSQWR